MRIKLFIVVVYVFLFSCGLDTRDYDASDKTDYDAISSNPYDIININLSTAVLLRYGSRYAWLVDLNASTNESFKKQQVDLYAYDTLDGIPEMMGAVAVSYTKQYDGIAEYIVIGMQRLQRTAGDWQVNRPAYLVVLKPDGTEFDTGLGSGGLKGIELRIRNPYRRIFYDKYNNYIYIAGAGSLLSNDGTGGIDRVKLNSDGTFSFDDDPDADGDNEYPFYVGHRITDLVVFSDGTGAFVEYTSWGNTCLRSFVASQGALSSNPDCEAGLGGEGINIYALETWKDPNSGEEYLFVAVNDNGPYLVILDKSFNIIKRLSVPDGMNPIDISLQYAVDALDSYLRIVLALSSPDWSSGAIALINCDAGITSCSFSPYDIKNPTISDLAVSAYNKDFYLLERYQKDSISKFNIDETDLGDFEPIWQYSTNE